MAVGNLCYKKNAYTLAYSSENSSALIYKADVAAPITLHISMSSTSWICNTYHATHSNMQVTVVAGWNSQSYVISGSDSITIPSSFITGKSSLSFTVAINDACAAHEDPQIYAFIIGTQEDNAKEVAVKCPLDTVGTKTLQILIKDNVMTGIQ